MLLDRLWKSNSFVSPIFRAFFLSPIAIGISKYRYSIGSAYLCESMKDVSTDSFEFILKRTVNNLPPKYYAKHNPFSGCPLSLSKAKLDFN